MTFCEVYRLNIDIPVSPEITKILHADELRRADRFIDSKVKNRFIICRFFLRKIISKYTNASPEDIIFEYGEHGKPYTKGIFFNISHSGSLCVVAISSEVIGVDLEDTDKKIEFLTLAKRYFSDKDFNYINNSSAELQKTLFYKLWCKREAYSKMLGISVWNTLNKTSFSEFKDCFFHEIEMPDSFCCILACRQEIAITIKSWID